MNQCVQGFLYCSTVISVHFNLSFIYLYFGLLKSMLFKRHTNWSVLPVTYRNLAVNV